MGLPQIAVVEFSDLFGSRDLAFVPAGECSVRDAFNGRKARKVPHCQLIKCPRLGLSYSRRGNQQYGSGSK
jgi:hypothetical protein